MTITARNPFLSISIQLYNKAKYPKGNMPIVSLTKRRDDDFTVFQMMKEDQPLEPQWKLQCYHRRKQHEVLVGTVRFDELKLHVVDEAVRHIFQGQTRFGRA